MELVFDGDTKRRRVGRGANTPRQGDHAVRKRGQAFGHLTLRNVHHADALIPQPVLADVADNADDLPGRLFELRSESLADHDDLTERVLFGPVLLRHRVVDDQHASGRAGVDLGERASAQQRNPEHPEVVRRHGPPLLVSAVLAPSRWLTDDPERQIDPGLDRKRNGGCRDIDARHRFDAPDDLRREGAHACRRRVRAAGQRGLERQHIARVQARIDRAQSHEAADQQRRSNQKNQRQRDFRDDQYRAYAFMPRAGAGAATGLLERRDQIRSHAPQLFQGHGRTQFPSAARGRW